MSGPRRCGSRRLAVVGDNSNGYVETDPTGRYGRLDELLGKGAMKSVYRGFDEERGVEVAWNQAYLADVLRTPDAVERMYSEVQLLSALRHDAIIGFHASWVDVPRRTFNFITELFSSGTLRSYRLRYPRVSLRAVRSWARQILRGLAYLHAHDPPVIHRDLKCDNLLVNGHQGLVKIADLGLAAVLRHQSTAHSVIGTPEFMAPEMYDEEYDERVDVYSFGMCMLEMLTVEYPYSECSNPAQIYKKVTAGKLPDAFYRVQDDDARRFIGRCLVAASKRPSAAELLMDPFLLDGHHHSTPCAVMPPSSSLPAAPHSSTCSTSNVDEDAEPPGPIRTDMTITGKLNAEEDTIFLKVQIADQTETNVDAGNNVRNIYFPFDMAGDTAAEVAEEMVKELEITDRDPSEIAAMIEQEINRLLPGREQQHEYSVCTANGDDDDDENEERPPPFYYLSSSPTSSQGSHCGVGPHAGGWSKDHWYTCLSDDDDTSSMHSGKYSALHYDASGHEEEEAQLPPQDGHVVGPSSCSKASGQQVKNTRFGPGESSSSRSPGRADTAQQQSLARQLQRQCSLSPHAGRPRRRDDDHRHHGRNNRMTRNRSMVDMRSQLLHRTLVEELNRRLFFNTVGAVEDIGFRAPAATTTSSSSSTRGRRSKDDKHHHQYVML
ncbi:probable serine/threonine-protein kinase WNK7 isoform X1 [Setaria viridis]|uniref:probable serine/threonine-protein kinase WNK7 isoform X1 n=1 Tax=Setaria viridis TaxID=4556 RepID=UPI001493416B|nr:probable serine/threonine-protein kinase WNK7 isoform X1 [Setaria viridis]XP_034568416.1 probable serine/threonine-protein kinase WNK7 isoform X1 [Setaria viridis]